MGSAGSALSDDLSSALQEEFPGLPPVEVSFADGPWAAVRDDVGDLGDETQNGAPGYGLALAAVWMALA